MLPFLNVFFFVFHTLWMAFNCIGWAWRRTRPWHLMTIVLTGLSWFVLGWRHGWGYCVCTDWHWQIRGQLGYPPDHSYTHLLLLGLTGINAPARLADIVTAAVFGLTALLSIGLNVRDFRRWRGSVAQLRPNEPGHDV